MASAADVGQQAVAVLLADHDVYGSAEGYDTTCHTLGGRQQLDAFYHRDVDGDIEGVVTCLGIGEVDAVEHDEHLVKGASAHREVALYVATAAHTEIYPGELCHEVADGMNG